MNNVKIFHILRIISNFEDFFLKKILVISINFMWKIVFINYLLVLNGEGERRRFENGAMDGEISRICDRNAKVEDLILEMKKFIY